MRYRTPEAFRAALDQRLKNEAAARGVALMRLRKRVGFERFLARLLVKQPADWILKGAFALDVRLGLATRATKDIDLARAGDEQAATAHLTAAAAVDLGDFFSFDVRRTPPHLAVLLHHHRETSRFKAGSDWVFATRNGTPLNQRNGQRSALSRAAHAAGLDQDGARLRFHDLRHTFASHLVVDLSLDVVQVSRILGHASPATTLDIYAHLFDEARHAADIPARMSRSEFARMLTPDTDENVIRLPTAARSNSPASARERPARRPDTPSSSPALVPPGSSASYAGPIPPMVSQFSVTEFRE